HLRAAAVAVLLAQSAGVGFDLGLQGCVVGHRGDAAQGQHTQADAAAQLGGDGHGRGSGAHRATRAFAISSIAPTAVAPAAAWWLSTTAKARRSPSPRSA